MGSGDYTYEVHRPWGRLPSGWEFGLVSHVAVDSEDRLYVYQRGDPPLIIFDSEGEFVGSWGADLIIDAHGIFISPQDHVYLVNRDAHQILKCTPEGQLLMALGTHETPSLQGPFNHPADVAVSQTGDIYIADGYANARVHKFSADGRLLLSWGSLGREPGQFIAPHGIWVDGNQRVYVADRENGRVQAFTTDGEFVGQWEHFFRPTDVYVDTDGAIYITDLVPSLTILDRQGNMLARGRPVLNTAHGIWGDSHGHLYIAEGQERRVTKLVRQRG